MKEANRKTFMENAQEKRLLSEFNLNLKYYFSEVLNKPLAKPYWIYISLSHQCNFNCQMCGVKKILRGQELDFTTLKKIFDEIASWKIDCVITLTGGEPFLRKDIFEIIGYSASLGLRTEVVTNGSQIADRGIAKKILASGLRNIAISLDGANSVTHDYIRGVEGAYQKALGALSYLCQEKKQAGCGPQISVWSTIMKENIEELSEIIFLAKGQGVECLVYHPVIVTQEDMQNTIKTGHFWVTEAGLPELRRQIGKIIDYQKQSGLVVFLHDPCLWLDYFQGTLAKKTWKCNPFVFIDIGPDGYVRSCGPAFGNVKEMSLAECLNTADAGKARERMMRCQKPCLQTCWARPEADSLNAATDTFLSGLRGLADNAAEKKEVLKYALESLVKYEDLILKGTLE